MTETSKYVYHFMEGDSDGDATMTDLLGGKGANLCEMTRIGLPVPPGYVISTEVCVHFFQNAWTLPIGFKEQADAALRRVEACMGRKFGDKSNPLLVSVRSGARVSMPGMMDSILNLGLNDETVKGLTESTGDERFAYDSYRRFIQMYGDVVLGIKDKNTDPFDAVIERVKEEKNTKADTDLTAEDWKRVVAEFKEIVRRHTGKEFPEDPEEQLWGAIKAVFRSWMNPRAVEYRKIYRIPEEWGTAVNVVTMVYGNMGNTSATGVAFTRNPATGEKELYGEYLMNAQGEDVVAGIRTPHSIQDMTNELPEAYAQFVALADKLEQHYKEMQDIEFTIEKGKLWVLQCRNGKRTGMAAMKIAIDMQNDGLISRREALLRINPDNLTQLLQPTFDRGSKEQAITEGRLLTKGLNAGPGAASGHMALSVEAVEEMAGAGKECILVRIETSPEDIKGMKSARGILTARGGMTSHAALIARQMGKVCVVGCGDLEIDYGKKSITVKGQSFKEGDYISIDGSTGEVISGEVATRPSDVIRSLIHKEEIEKDSQSLDIFNKVMAWADEYREMLVFANADLPDQCEQALALGAEGVGLCRTEHMFFGEERISVVRSAILARDEETQNRSLQRLLEMQRGDFEGIFRVMNGLSVTIRTLDPPLHEFLPREDWEIQSVAEMLGIDKEKVRHQIEELEEVNPMLGMRGCRLGIMFPEIIEMQVQAIMEAACNVQSEGTRVRLHIMIPLVVHVNELNNQKQIVDKIARRVFAQKGTKVKYEVGTMIEAPRAAMTADEIARTAEFFSFGTNDLTQTTLGLSRDDAARFLPHYLEAEIIKYDPFVTIDQGGVGALMQIAVTKGRQSRSDLVIGICGEQGGDPRSVAFCYRLDLDYVSCSPFRIPIARLCAAQAVVFKRGKRID